MEHLIEIIIVKKIFAIQLTHFLNLTLAFGLFYCKKFYFNKIRIELFYSYIIIINNYFANFKYLDVKKNKKQNTNSIDDNF